MKYIKYYIKLNDLRLPSKYALSTQIAWILNHPKGWGKQLGIQFNEINSQQWADLTFYFTPQPLFFTNWSFYCALNRTLYLNSDNWVTRDLDYHIYLINHELGHFLNRKHLHICLPDGSAPVMMQQTNGCSCEKTNGWPSNLDVRSIHPIEVIWFYYLGILILISRLLIFLI